MKFEKPTHEQLDQRYVHHPPTGQKQIDRYASIRSKINETAKHVVDLTPCSPEQSLALNALDQAMFLANASIARHENAAALNS